jgi:hypothetical protein
MAFLRAMYHTLYRKLYPRILVDRAREICDAIGSTALQLIAYISGRTTFEEPCPPKAKVRVRIVSSAPLPLQLPNLPSEGLGSQQSEPCEVLADAP